MGDVWAGLGTSWASLGRDNLAGYWTGYCTVGCWLAGYCLVWLVTACLACLVCTDLFRRRPDPG